MFKFESYITPLLLSYVDKYVKDFKPPDAQVSLWAGGVVLHNLVLKEDILQQGVSLPFKLLSGRIHELHIQVPWTKIMSEPIIVTIDTIECVLSLKTSADDCSQTENRESQRQQVVETPPGYMQALVRRIVSNIALRVHHLILKYVEDDIVLSLNVKHMSIESVGPDWAPLFTDISQEEPLLRRLVQLDDLTLCLDQTDSDGKIRFYQEPLLYRCQLTFRVLTRLISATTRRAQYQDIEMISSKLAWGVTSEQLPLLLRLMRERVPEDTKPSSSRPPPTSPKVGQPSTAPSSNAGTSAMEPSRRESWSQWAWSFIPTWSDREGGFEETPPPPVAVPLHFAAHLDCVSLAYKAMELEQNNKKRARAVLEYNADGFAIKSTFCTPTLVHISLGAKYMKIQSQGKCLCGYTDINTLAGEPTMYLYNCPTANHSESWQWPENWNESPEPETSTNQNHNNEQAQNNEERRPSDSSNAPNTKNNICRNYRPFWQKFEPFFFLEYDHDRSPPYPNMNPYDNPPTEFEYSDWPEESSLTLRICPLEIRICMGFIHRVASIVEVIKKMPKFPEKELPMRVLTVEECDALTENLPRRHVNFEIRLLRIGIHPWEHCSLERPAKTPLLLYIDIPKVHSFATMPLYPHRVCNAASQLSGEDDALSRGARLHLVGSVASLQVSVGNPRSSQAARPIARMQLRFALHRLLRQNYFTRPEIVMTAFSTKLKEISICGSSARLQAVYQIVNSLIRDQQSINLKYTTLAHDALHDQDAPVVDVTCEDMSIRGYLTKDSKTFVLALQSAKATILHATGKDGMKQAWLFSAPDVPTSSSYLRVALQICDESKSNPINYLGVWTEPIAICIDPVLAAWLAYTPQPLPGADPVSAALPKVLPSSSYVSRRRATPPLQSIGRVPASRSGSGSELVHAVRARSQASGSENKPNKNTSATETTNNNKSEGENLNKLYLRLKKVLINGDLGFVMLYVTATTASAVDSATVRDALERHAVAGNKVVVTSLGRLSVHSSSASKQLWHEIRSDGPTFLNPAQPKLQVEDSFPWKIRLADVTCYTLHVHVTDRTFDRSRSQLRVPSVIAPKTVLELLTTTVTMSVVTKTLTLKKNKQAAAKHESLAEKKVKYFTQGIDFKPSTLKEFIRGPTSKNKAAQSDQNKAETSTEKGGPVVYVGVCVHADTPPILVRLDQDQFNIVAMAIHSIGHILSLLRQRPVHASRPSGGSQGGSLKRSVSEVDEPGPSNSDTHSDKSVLIPIFEQPTQTGPKVKTSFWFQWVTNRITFIAISSSVRFTFNIEDVMSTIDLQTNYNQFKLKMASAAIRNYQMQHDEWVTGVFGGRVLEVRETTRNADENQFLTITVTQAEVANLPTSWKEELHPKFLEKSDGYSIWEVYATLAPLEGVLRPSIVRNAVTMFREISAKFECPMPVKTTVTPNRSIQWPYCYVSAGGFRILVSTEDAEFSRDDTFVLSVGKISVNPHPENPIIRRTTSTSTDGTWLTVGGGFEGRQYEMVVNNLTLQTVQFSQLLNEEDSSNTNCTGAENPALLWSRPPVTPVLTTILHPLDISCILAPAIYVGDTVASELAVELNLISDCEVDIGLSQLRLFAAFAAELDAATKLRLNREIGSEDKCSYGTMILAQNKGVKASQSQEQAAGEVSSQLYQSNDSGPETVSMYSTATTTSVYKKSVSIVFADEIGETPDNIEFFVTVGAVRATLYTIDDRSSRLADLRPPVQDTPPVEPESQKKQPKQKKEKAHDVISVGGSLSGTVSSTDDRNVKPAHCTTNLMKAAGATSRKIDGILPLATITMQQPNMYYWKRRSQKSLQVSLFNAWVGLGASPAEGGWNLSLFRTAKGQPDPVSDIPPALLTMKLVLPSSSGSHMPSSTASRGTLRVDLDRPCVIDVCVDRIRRLRAIITFMQSSAEGSALELGTATAQKPALLKIRKILMDQNIESIKMRTCQIGVQGSEGVLGWDECNLQMVGASRYDRMLVRGMVTALQANVATDGEENRRPSLHPLVAGIEAEISWEAWQRAEGGNVAEEPTVSLRVDLDRVTVDLLPDDLAALNRIVTSTDSAFNLTPPPKSTRSFPIHNRFGKPSKLTLPHQSSGKFSTKKTYHLTECLDHYYKDDLRSGAFKVAVGNQLPMAYQILLQDDAVAWRYPHPRAITRFLVLPLPDQNEEVPCVLEYYSTTLSRWEPHTMFKLPVTDIKEVNVSITPPDAVFASIWRFRLCPGFEEFPVFQFDIQRFSARLDTAIGEQCQEQRAGRRGAAVSPHELASTLRVDSYFAPKLLPNLKVALQVARLELHLHNKLPPMPKESSVLRGYYLCKPRVRSHRVVSLVARDTLIQVHLGSEAGKLVMAHTRLASDIIDSSTGLMERFVDETRAQAAVTLPADIDNLRTLFCTSTFKVSLNLPRLRALQSLTNHWMKAISEITNKCKNVTVDAPTPSSAMNSQEIAKETAEALEGLISLWVYNGCSTSMHMGQEATDEVVLLPPGARLAYRWRCTNAPKKLRFSIGNGPMDLNWSESVSFQEETTHVRIKTSFEQGNNQIYLYARLEDRGVTSYMHLSGRLQLANLLRKPLYYKVRARNIDSSTWSTVCTGELDAETLDTTVLCNVDCELMLRIKFAQQNTPWTGDIPLKECPKENVPWLVKVPCEGDVPYVSVWCRVVRGRSDGRVLAAIWPLYVLHSHLPLDVDILITTEVGPVCATDKDPPPLVQSAPGRGASTHLMPPGTTSARHSLILQYKNIETQVTRDVIPLHYGMTDTSVFDKRVSVRYIEEVAREINEWLNNNAKDRSTGWPYSCVSRHWPGQWMPALLQPRADVTVRYSAVRAGGGCCLDLHLRPAALLCNAAPIPLTLRAHDAAPLCKVEPGAAIVAPSLILKKPFFMSIETGHETFVSDELMLSHSEPGPYAALPQGQFAPDRPVNFSIHCGHKVAMLTLFYEIKDEISVFGLTATYRLINKLGLKILVSTMIVPDVDSDKAVGPKNFEAIDPDCTNGPGTPLAKLWLRGRWRPSEAKSSRCYLWLALPDASGSFPAHSPVPVLLGDTSVRRAIALKHSAHRSVPVVVTQQKVEDTLLISVAEDPYPQFYIQNYTQMSLVVAEPKSPPDEPSTSRAGVCVECPGLQWHWRAEAVSATHYSTPTHCARHPAAANAATDTAAGLPFLCFANVTGGYAVWSPPIAVADGEHLLQTPGCKTIKMRVFTYHHSTLIELHDVDQKDISASDIRRRLQNTSSESTTSSIRVEEIEINDCDLRFIERVAATEKTYDQSSSSLETDLEPEFAGGTQSEREAKLENATHFDDMVPVTDDAAKNDKSDHRPTVTFENSSTSDSTADNMCVESGERLHCVERARCVLGGVIVALSSSARAPPLLVTHLQRVAVMLTNTHKGRTVKISIADLQIDNREYENGQYDFPVVATTRRGNSTVGGDEALDRWPFVGNMFGDKDALPLLTEDVAALVRAHYDTWTVGTVDFTELTEIEVKVGSLALYIEDAYVTALAELATRLRSPGGDGGDDAPEPPAAEGAPVARPLRLRSLHIHPLDLTLTLHTAVRMYIALDQSPLRLSAFRLHHLVTTSERLTHALTVHYLSAAVLAAGWVVGGLELLGAPGALAARVGGARGGVRGVATAAAAALLRSVSAWAGSLARNLDLLAGDEEHARRAAAARRRPPHTLLAGLLVGVTNLAVNMLGAVGGLAHHPLVGAAVGESGGAAAGLRRGIIGAVTKPLSATADLLAFAGHGLLHQTGWEPLAQALPWIDTEIDRESQSGWQRECVRWAFKLADVRPIAGYRVLLDDAPLLLLLSLKYLIVADPETEKIIEMVEYKNCSVAPYRGPIIQLTIRPNSPDTNASVEETPEYQMCAAMARVARYTGAARGGPAPADERRVRVLPAPGHAPALHAALAALTHAHAPTHFPFF